VLNPDLPHPISLLSQIDPASRVGNPFWSLRGEKEANRQGANAPDEHDDHDDEASETVKIGGDASRKADGAEG
jgi:hypothetical protein